MYIKAIFTFASMAAVTAMKMMPTCFELCFKHYQNDFYPKPVECDCIEPRGKVNDISTFQFNNGALIQQQKYISPTSSYNPDLAVVKLYKKDNGKGRGMKRFKKHRKSKKNKPVYIDIEISKLESSEAGSKKPDNSAQSLEDCLDIYAFLHSRRSHSMPQLKERWGSEKFERYVYLSNADLLKESTIKCSEPNYIIKQSLDQIKQSLPSSSGKSKFVKDRINYTFEKSAVIPENNLKNNKNKINIEIVDEPETQSTTPSLSSYNEDSESKDLSYILGETGQEILIDSPLIANQIANIGQVNDNNWNDMTTTPKNIDSENKYDITTETSPPVLTTEFSKADGDMLDEIELLSILDSGFTTTTQSSQDTETTTETIVNLTTTENNTQILETESVKAQSLTGRMYFNMNNMNIPARFIQDLSGNIQLTIDTVSLCNKLDFSSNGSVLIYMMCKCVQSKLCS